MPEDHRLDPYADALYAENPMSAENLTLQQAADALNMSRKYLEKLLDEGQLPFTRTPDGIRIRAADIHPFKRTWKARRREALDELVRLTEELGGYEHELREARGREETERREREP